MKTYALYGFGLTLTSAVLTLVLYLTGFQSDVDKFLIGLGLGILLGLAAVVLFLILGIKAARAAAGAAAGFSYGKALVSGLLITVFAAVFSAPFNCLYFGFINSEYTETTVAWTTRMMEKGNLPQYKIDETVDKIRQRSTPLRQTINGAISALVGGAIISLIVAGVMKREPEETFRPELTEPPRTV
jgi:hypothetical protein